MYGGHSSMEEKLSKEAFVKLLVGNQKKRKARKKNDALQLKICIIDSKQRMKKLYRGNNLRPKR